MFEHESRHRTFWQSRRSVSCGAATVEAVIALPVLILLFAGLFHFRELSAAKHGAMTTARTCAWLYSAKNCSEVPAGCEHILREGEPGDRGSDVREALEKGKDKIGGSGGDSDVVSNIIEGLLGKELRKAFGRFAAAEAKGHVTTPPLFGRGTAVVTGKYNLACNLEPTTPAKVVKDAWHLFRPGDGD